MSYILVSDIHGFCSELMRAIAPVMGKDDVLVVLGDILDRGKEAKATVAFLMRLLSEGRLILIRGNHEDLFLDCLRDIENGRIYWAASASHHLTNGTFDTLLQLTDMTVEQALDDPMELVRRAKESDYYKTLIPACRDYVEIDNYILVHGWIPAMVDGWGRYARYFYDPYWRDATAEEWRLARWFNGMELAHFHKIREDGKVIVCGHWHTSYGHSVINGRGDEFGENADHSPYFGPGIMAIDGSTARTGKVNCVVIEGEIL